MAVPLLLSGLGDVCGRRRGWVSKSMNKTREAASTSSLHPNPATVDLRESIEGGVFDDSTPAQNCVTDPGTVWSLPEHNTV